MKISLGTDHGGFELKEAIKQWLIKQGHQVIDRGAFKLDPKDDYPDFAKLVAKDVAADPKAIGILFCRSGGGMTIAANKFKKIRAVDVVDEKSATHAKKDNNANVISLGADWTSERKAKASIKAFLKTKFKAEPRHVRRLKKIEQYESLSHYPD
ncbi:MAG: RpiB/LacA/LacB family sugar-phosphate isomerase [Candidatus Woesebacteria bacterium]|jgi:ribose 5-phosphate isomerase B